MQEIWDALEAVTPARGRGMFDSKTASRRDILNHRDMLMRFLSEINGELSVGELRTALEEYTGDDN